MLLVLLFSFSVRKSDQNGICLVVGFLFVTLETKSNSLCLTMYVALKKTRRFSRIMFGKSADAVDQD